jgi:hypothetical protein
VLFFRTRPTQGKSLIEPFPLLTEVSEEGNIGDQSEIKRDGADGKIGHDTADVPEKRGLKLRISENIEHPIGSSQID